MKRVPSSFRPAYPEYLTPELKAKPNVWRYDPEVSRHLDRYYIKWGKTPKTYISLTSLINAMIPKGYHFYKWVAKTGERSKIISDTSAIYGTMYHKICMDPLFRKVGFDFEEMAADHESYPQYTNFQMIFPPGYREKAKGWYEGFMRGLMSFWEFAKERIVQIIAVEIPLVSDKWNYGGTLDIVCILKFGRKEVLAIVDLKSKILTMLREEGETKTYYKDHEAQLVLQKMLLIENYPGLVKKYADGDPDNIMLFNWNPKNWKVKYAKGEDGELEVRRGDSYDLVNQTKTKYQDVIKVTGSRTKRRRMELMLDTVDWDELPKPPSSFVDVKGGFDNLDQFNLEDHIELIEL